MTLPWTWDGGLLFAKKLSFDASGFPKLDSIDGHFLSSPLWEFDEGSNLKMDLDKVRSRLRDIEHTQWKEHTSRTNLTSFVIPTIRKLVLNISNELLTRSWCKLMEILMSHPVIDLDSQTIKDNGFNGLFLCEAPGSFVHAAHHYIKSERPETPFNWLASSLNVYYEESDVIRAANNDDRFIQYLPTYGNWIFGEDDRGNLLDVNLIKQICNRYKDSGADLVTGDGSARYPNEPEKQEEQSFPLTFHQFLTAINCLKPGGSLVLRMFNLFSSQSLSLAYLANSLFDQVHCYKPVHSKPGNAEVYLICINLLFRKRNLIKTITSQYFDKFQAQSNIFATCSLLDQSLIPLGFIRQFTVCSIFFKDFQKASLTQDLDLYNDPTSKYLYASLTQFKKILASNYTSKRFPLKVICDQLADGHHYNHHKFNPFEYAQFFLSSFIESYNDPSTETKVTFSKIYETLDSLYIDKEVDQVIGSWASVNHSNGLPTIEFKFGKPYTYITNSKFVETNLLYLLKAVASQGMGLISMQSDSQMYLSRIRTNVKSHKLLISILESTLTEFGQVTGPESSIVSKHLAETLRVLANEYGLVEHAEDFDAGTFIQRNLIIIDPYNYEDVPMCNGRFTLIEREQCLIEKMIDQLIVDLPRTQYFDFLAIHTPSVLSRLMVQLIFILTALFKQISVIPNFSYDRVGATSNNIQVHQSFQLGMLIILANSDKRSPEFVAHKDQVISVLKQIKSALVETRDSDKTLLEIFPIVQVYPNQSFCEFIFTSNFVHLTDLMRSLFEFAKFSRRYIAP